MIPPLIWSYVCMCIFFQKSLKVSIYAINKPSQCWLTIPPQTVFVCVLGQWVEGWGYMLFSRLSVSLSIHLLGFHPLGWGEGEYLISTAYWQFLVYLWNCLFSTSVGGGWVLRRCPCILSHQGVQLILAYSLARPAILVAGKGRGEGVLLFLLFLHFLSFSFLPCPSLSSPLLSLLSVFSLCLGDDTK